MILTPFKMEHLLQMEPMLMPNGFAMVPSEVLRKGTAYLKGVSYSIEHNGRIIACGGIKNLWSGVGEAWCVFSIHAKEHFVSISRLARRRFTEISHCFYRVQALVVDGFDKGCEFAEFFGFEYEGTLRQYGQKGEDFRMYAKVR